VRLRDQSEWKTLALMLSVYVAWIGIVWGTIDVPGWLACIFLILTITLHSSLQHECIHGHPFKNQLLNDLLAFPSLGLFLPYFRYKEQHLLHHQKVSLTDPKEDPESWYLTEEQWRSLSRPMQVLFQLNNTLVGRLILGPLLGMGRLTLGDIRKMRFGDKNLIKIWSIHAVFIFVFLSIVVYAGAISITIFLISAYAGMSILMIRTYLEHQSHPSVRARSVIIEDRGILSYLFLNNNLHAVHHAYPAVAWYKLPHLFSKNRQQFLALNKGYYFKNYTDIIRKFFFHGKEPVLYPLKSKNR
jgi:fatty acid desaturase